MEPATGPSASRGWLGGAAWGFGQDSSAPAASAQAPSTGQLFPHHSEVWPPASAQRGTSGHRAIYLALWPPVSALCRLHFRKSRTLYPNCVLPALPTLCPGGASASQAREEQMVCSLPAPLLGGSRGTALEAPPCHPPVLWVSFLWRLLAGWLGPSSPWPPSFYLCWCLQFGVGSLGRQLRPVLAERCCLSLCGWTRPSLAPPRTL